MYICLKNDATIQIDSEQTLRQLLSDGTLNGSDSVSDSSTNETLLLQDTVWYKNITQPVHNPSTSEITPPKKKNNALLIGIIVSVLLAIIAAATLFGIIAYQKADQVKKQDKFDKTFVEMSETVMSGKEWAPIEFDKSVYGESAPLGKLLQDFLLSMKKGSNEMQAKFAASGLEAALDEKTLSDVTKIKAAKTKLNTLVNDMDTYEKSTRDLMSKMESNIDKIDVPESVKKAVKSGYVEKMTSKQKDINNFFSIEQKILKTVSKILDFMESKQGKYSYENGALTFQTDEDVNEYNNLITELQTLSAEETAWTQKMQEDGQKSLDKFKKTVE